MTYRLEFLEAALREWKKLDPSIQNQFKKVLGKRLLSPHVPSARLSGPDMQNTYKIKLRNAGYRLVYEVHDDVVTVIVLSVSKRDKGKAYSLAQLRKSK